MLSGRKTPASLKSFETELKKAEKELEQLEKKKIEIDVSLNNEQKNYSNLVKKGDTANANISARKINSIDIDSTEAEKNINSLESKINDLTNKIEDVKFNPQNSKEVKELQQQLGLAESKLDSSVKKANELKNEYNSLTGKSFLDSLNKANSKAKKLGTTLLSSLSNKNPLKSINNQLNSLNKKVGQLGKRITGLITGALIFNVLSSGLSKLSNGLIGALNSNSQFASSLNQIKVNLLTTFAPIYNYVLPAINALMSALSNVTGQIATFVTGLFGQTANQAKNSAKSIYNQSKAYQDLGKSAKKTKNTLSSLDEVEILNDNENDGTSGAGSGNTPSLDFSGEVEQSGKLLDYLNEIKTLISQGDFFGVGQKLANSVNNILNSIDVVSFTNKIHKGLQKTIQIFNGFINELDFSLLGTKTSQLATGLTKALADAIKAVEWDTLGKDISDFITNIDWGQLTINIFDIIWNTISGIGTTLLSIDWGAITSKLSEGLHLLLEHIREMVLNTDWEQLGKNIVNKIIDFITNINWGQLMLDILVLWASIVFSKISLITGAFEAIWEGIKKIFGDNVTNWFKDKFSQAWQAVRNVFSNGGQIFNGIKEGILNGLKLVINGLISGINHVITIPFNGINTALRTVRDISFMGVAPFKGLIKTIKTPQIPYLAKGAVIPPNAQFAAILGDQKHGRNLEAPEDLIRQIIREEGISSEVVSLLIDLNRNILALSNMCAILNIDSAEMARALFKPLENERNRQQQSTTVVRS